jgi:hypothetical protein
MKRRDVLTTTAAIAFAGCLGGGDNGSDGNTGNGSETTDESSAMGTEKSTDGTVAPTPTDAGASTPQTVRKTETGATTRTVTEPAGTTEPTGTATGTATELTNTTISAPDRLTVVKEDGPPTTEARVTFESGGSRVVVTGTITGKNGCQTAVLDSVQKTSSGLVITIATERDAPTDAACSMALVGIKYRCSVRVETPPESVTVIHHGVDGEKTVTTANPGS